MAHPFFSILHLCCRLLLFTQVGVGEPVTPISEPGPIDWLDTFPRPNCESAYEGIDYCIEDDGDIHIIVIDLDNPRIRFEMVMADDVASVDTTHRERIEDMVNRLLDEDQEIVAAINADYFGLRHGPEGLTVKNGQRLDGERGERQNPNALWRSSLAISRLNRVSLGRKSAEELDDPRTYRERIFNAIGGGPLILSYGVIIPNTVACLLERFPVGACRRTIQTAAGLSQDGRWLYLAVGRGRDIQGFARLLRDYGAFTAIKLDGGGSSQLWYDGLMRHDTDRPVGNAMVVFYTPMPRHDARFRGLSDYLIVEPGEHVEIVYEIQNTGYLDWEPDLGYRFKNVQGWPVLGPAFQRLPSPVSAGSSLISNWTVIAPQLPGVYRAEWQLVRRSEAIGSQMRFDIIVLPPGSTETGFKEQIESQLRAWRSRSGFEQAWPDLSQELENDIWSEISADLRTALSDENGWLIASVEAQIRTGWMPPLRYLAW